MQVAVAEVVEIESGFVMKLIKVDYWYDCSSKANGQADYNELQLLRPRRELETFYSMWMIMTSLILVLKVRYVDLLMQVAVDGDGMSDYLDFVKVHR